MKGSEKEQTRKLEHAVFILKSFTDNKANSYMCLIVDVI